MKKFLAVCACLMLFSFLFVPHTSVYSQKRDSRQLYADDQIVVKLKAGIEPASDADSMAEEIFHAPGVRSETLAARRHAGAQLIHLNRTLSVEDAVRRAQEDPRIEYAGPDYLFYAMDKIPEDPYFNELWGMSNASCSFCDPGFQTPNIDATRAWEITTGSDDIVAVVLDTGVDLQHEDLADNAWVNPNPGILPGFVNDINGWNFYDNNSHTFVSAADDFHGTHVAGTLGAVGNNQKGVTGVAWRVKIMSLKFLGGSMGSGSTSDAVRGINYAIDMRNRGVNVRVINASWGGPRDSQALRDAIAAANTAGILFVCAAGNSGVNLDDLPDFPSNNLNDAFPGAYARALPNVISVAAVEVNGRLASYSNFGHNSVSVAAPGGAGCNCPSDIRSTWPGNDYRYIGGTSMAAPHVSGIAVLLWSQNPSLTPEQVKQRIVDTSEPLPSLVSVVARSGRASAYDALTQPTVLPKTPVVLNVKFTKRMVTVNGFGFVDGSAIIEVDGVPLPEVSYDSSFGLANGTLTQLTADIGKKPLKRTFPSGVQVSVDVFNPTTGERSARFATTRF